MKSYAEMLEQAKSGTISQSDVRKVAQDLLSSTTADPYTLLHILGKAEAKSYFTLVEKFLDYKQDPMVARLALQILCSYWSLSGKYLKRLREFLTGVSWDVEDEVREAAASIAGEYLRENRDASLYRTLIQLFKDERKSQSVREAAYLALARASGLEWQDLPFASRHFDLLADTDPSVLKFGEEMAQAS